MRYSVFLVPLGKMVYESDNLGRTMQYIKGNKCCWRKFRVFDNHKKRFLKCCDYDKSCKKKSK